MSQLNIAQLWGYDLQQILESDAVVFKIKKQDSDQPLNNTVTSVFLIINVRVKLRPLDQQYM